MTSLEHLYHSFLKDKINKNYFKGYIASTVYGENFLNGYYYLIFGVKKFETTDIYLVFENCEESKLLFLCSHKFFQKGRYQIFSKHILKNNLPEKAFQSLVKNGLWKNLFSGQNDNDSYTSIHRLNVCIYSNIKGLDVHHRNKIKDHNSVNNLVPIDSASHTLLDMLEGKEYNVESDNLYNQYTQTLFAPKRKTLATSDEIVIDVLIQLYKGQSVNDIYKILKRKIGITTIYKIKNYYFYLEDFFKYLESIVYKGLSLFDENKYSEWQEIKVFESNNKAKDVDFTSFRSWFGPYWLKVFPKGLSP